MCARVRACLQESSVAALRRRGKGDVPCVGLKPLTFITPQTVLPVMFQEAVAHIIMVEHMYRLFHHQVFCNLRNILTETLSLSSLFLSFHFKFENNFVSLQNDRQDYED